MINCYSIKGNIYDTPVVFDNFDEIYKSVEKSRRSLESMPENVILDMLDEYSRRLSKNRKLLAIEGAAYLSFYFRKSNMEKLVEMSVGDKRYMDGFVECGAGKFKRARNRGVCCHFIAGNVVTLAFYSIFQSLVAKNSNIARIPESIMPVVIKFLALLEDIEVSFEGRSYSSRILLENIVLVYFKSSDRILSESMSHLADARVIWGGEKAVDSIGVLGKKTTCHDIVFGPKYSFAVFDSMAVESRHANVYFEKLALDISLFNKKACSSPQVIFVEKSSISFKHIGEMLKAAFEKSKRPMDFISEAECAQVINMRGLYLLDEKKCICSSRGLEYTILMDKVERLEEPMPGRCIFLKEIESILELDQLITPRIQTIGCAVCDRKKLFEFAERVTSRGVDRIVDVGSMNIYDSPWDGYFLIGQLVRWCSLNF